MDPVIAEFSRVRDPKDIRFSKLREWQAYFQHTIQPRLDKLAMIEASNGTDPKAKKKAAEVTA